MSRGMSAFEIEVSKTGPLCKISCTSPEMKFLDNKLTKNKKTQPCT
jgi:hypothetical protein